MKLYLAATAPGNEFSTSETCLQLPRRLLSKNKQFESDRVFASILRGGK